MKMSSVRFTIYINF